MSERSSPTNAAIPRWLRAVLVCDRTGSAWYIGAGFFFAPILILVSPWPELTAVLWVVIAVAGLWLGLLGVAMATGLAIVLRANAEIPEDYWRTVIDYPQTTPRAAADGACQPSISRTVAPTSRAPRRDVGVSPGH
ncbi:hypothetical protein [Mycobacterium sp. SMC-4]|uniref:hypothetical protein n=1 Tax=Mycobacterium sp. SMC-4 TaxID=2857059 RepID=UPI0021B4405C|nr:hypothetical protein [Mycobacterium sp. SMC-4]